MGALISMRWRNALSSVLAYKSCGHKLLSGEAEDTPCRAAHLRFRSAVVPSSPGGLQPGTEYRIHEPYRGVQSHVVFPLLLF